ncbi:MAG TPA: insulinase family protein [Allosphingosinicella sp.]|uniref:M16 family metallopeptidase n=1 Tax=Allosphingosinicella sp. TaxID=2823234 RepID=UPI002ED9EB46
MAFLRSCLPALLILLTPVSAAAQIGDSGWLYRGSDIPPDPAWVFGTLPNGVRYAVRQNAMPKGQVSIRVRIAAGALHEEDREQGWAHLVEHLVFRGTASFGDREARHIWERLGASFGSDSNASTTSTQTVYQLDLPDADRADLDTSLKVVAEMMDSALFAPAAVDAEKKIVLQEKGRRSELSTKMWDVSAPLFYAGLKLRDRNTIGTDATLNGANAEGLRAFYERWYRPDRATVILVGDADPKMMEELVAKHFGNWRASGPAPAEPDIGRIAEVAERTATLSYPGAPHSASVMWLRPYRQEADTRAREKEDLARSLAMRIINRRLEARARGDAAYVGAGVGETEEREIADYTQLSVTAKDGKWREALSESFAIIADALRSPPSESEITREISNLRTAATAAVAGESTVRSQQRAQLMVAAIDGNSVVTTAETGLALIEGFAPQMTPALIGETMKTLFKGSGPRMVLLAPEAITTADAGAALAAAEKAAPATRAAERTVSFDVLPKLGPEGREVSRQRIEDLDATIVRFANGSTLTFKQTDFEKGSVGVQLRFGSGIAGLAPDRTSIHQMGAVIGQSGLADLDLDAMERLLTGRRISLSFTTSEDSFVLRGQTNGTQLEDQLRLLATKVAHPRWDPALFARAKTATLQSYDLAFASASSRGGREFPGLARPGDRRWQPLEKDVIARTSLAEVQALFDPLLASGPIEAVIVGDVDLQTAVAAMRKTVAALPPRAAAPEAAGSRQVRPPAPNPKPVVHTHNGDANQAFAVIGWSTFGGSGNIKDKRALSLAANIFQVRLFDRFREAEGASYSPSARSSISDEFPDWGIFYASSELRPESTDAFLRAAREIAADLAAKPVEADEFERAQNPVISGIQRTVRTNGYWMGALEDWTRRPAKIGEVRSYLADYRGLTPEDVRAAVAKYVTDAGDWSMLVLPAKGGSGVD